MSERAQTRRSKDALAIGGEGEALREGEVDSDAHGDQLDKRAQEVDTDGALYRPLSDVTGKRFGMSVRLSTMFLI